MSKVYEVVIVGSGASAMACAGVLNAHDVAVIEQNSEIAKKVRISGGGKCNITNKYMDASHFLGSQEFVAQALKRFDEQNMLTLLARYNVPYTCDPKIVRGTYFCNSSKDVIKLYKKMTDKVRFFLSMTVSEVCKSDGIFTIVTDKQTFKARHVVVASGGISYGQVGVSDIGYKVAKSFGHKVTDPGAALVGLTVQKPQFWFKKLSGLSIDVRASVGNKAFEGSLLFTHKGISGPVVLSTSLYWQKGQIVLDFMPKNNVKTFVKSKQSLSNALPLPKRFTKLFLESIGVADRPCKELSKKDLQKLSCLHHYELSPAGNFGLSKAEVTKGGVDTQQIDASMQSTQVEGLYFVGEVLDVTGELGGYNLQWAHSSGYICAKAIEAKLQ
ncbi:MAG: NAD(P)/FAD-dependent oxidoreductase [Campylobacterota bacterium]